MTLEHRVLRGLFAAEPGRESFEAKRLFTPLLKIGKSACQVRRYFIRKIVFNAKSGRPDLRFRTFRSSWLVVNRAVGELIH
jgi:hypothetical protein